MPNMPLLSYGSTDRADLFSSFFRNANKFIKDLMCTKFNHKKLILTILLKAGLIYFRI